MQITALEVALRSATIRGTHALPDGKGRHDETGAPETLRVLRMQIAVLDAWLYAFDGERRKVYQLARRAERMAPNETWLVWAFANSAQLSAAFGDQDWAAEFADDAAAIVKDIDWNATDDEERIALLHLAEILAQTDPGKASSVLGQYDRLTSKVDRTLTMHKDARLWILETFVRALVDRNRGDTARAAKSLRGVRERAQRLGMRWREAMALIELDALEPGSLENGERPIELAASIIMEHFPRSFLVRRLGQWGQILADPIASKLSPQPRNVLRQVLSGKNPKEVAVMMRLSEDTIKGYFKTLFRAFSVNSTPQLIVKCYERGLGSPPRRVPPSNAEVHTNARAFAKKQARPQRASGL